MFCTAIGGNEDALLDKGDASLRLRQIIGNAIASGEAEDMIAVFPDIFGYVGAMCPAPGLTTDLLSDAQLTSGTTLTAANTTERLFVLTFTTSSEPFSRLHKLIGRHLHNVV